MIPRTSPGPDATKSPSGQAPKKRPPQFTLTTLFMLMVVVGLAAAPGYYLTRAQEGKEGMQLVGMIVMLTGPMFLAIILSVFLSLQGWWKKR